MNDAIKMQISAFVDGELPDNESELLLRRLTQDLELRQQAAEYLAMGRALRGHRVVGGIEHLRERIAAALDDTSLQEEFDSIEPVSRRYLRPVAGAAIAAAVALVAIVGLQQVGGFSDVEIAPVADVTDGAGAGPSYTVPDAHRGLHNMEAGDLDALRATFERRADEIVEAEPDDDEADAADEDTESAATEAGQTP